MKISLAQPPGWFHGGFLLFAAAFLYFNVFILPATPIYDPLAVDQWFYLHNATRMLGGQMIYRDFFQYSPPGTELTYLALFRLFAVRAWIPNAMLVLLGSSLTWLCFFISRKVLTGLAAYLPGLLFLSVAFCSRLDATHRWYSVLAVTAATALVIEERNQKRVAGAAALCALGAFFTQARGLMAVTGLAIFLWWEHRKKGQVGRSLLNAEAILAGVFSAVTLGLNVYFILAVGLRRFLWSIVIFGMKYYPAESGSNSLQTYMLSLPHPTNWRGFVGLPSWVLIHALLPLVYLLFFARCWGESKKRQGEPWERLVLVSLMGFFLFVGVAPAPAFARLCTVALPALIIWVWFLSSPGKFPSLARKVIWLCAVVVLVGPALHKQTKWRAYLNAPIGRVAFVWPEAYEYYKWLLFHTHPTEFIYDCAGQVYFFLGLKCPAQVQYLSGTDYMRPEQVRNVIESLDVHHVSMVLWCPYLDPGVDGIRADDHLGPLRDYLQTHYHPVKAFEDAVQVLAGCGKSAFCSKIEVVHKPVLSSEEGPKVGPYHCEGEPEGSFRIS